MAKGYVFINLAGEGREREDQDVSEIPSRAYWPIAVFYTFTTVILGSLGADMGADPYVYVPASVGLGVLTVWKFL